MVCACESTRSAGEVTLWTSKQSECLIISQAQVAVSLPWGSYDVGNDYGCLCVFICVCMCVCLFACQLISHEAFAAQETLSGGRSLAVLMDHHGLYHSPYWP